MGREDGGRPYGLLDSDDAELAGHLYSLQHPALLLRLLPLLSIVLSIGLPGIHWIWAGGFGLDD